MPMVRTRSLSAAPLGLLATLVAPGCGLLVDPSYGAPTEADAGFVVRRDAEVVDSARDVGTVDDAERRDVVVVDDDGRERPDVTTADATFVDAASTDAEARDDEPFDTGVLDTGALDAGPFDAGTFDGGPFDAGTIDAGVVDTGPLDAGPLDAGVVDARPGDAPFLDVPMVDVAPADVDLCVPRARALAPLSGSVVTTATPTLVWTSTSCAGPVQVVVCNDPRCAVVRESSVLSLTAGIYRVATDLPAQTTFFWQLRWGTGFASRSPTWFFRVPARPVGSTTMPRAATAWGRIPDGDGDGYAELVVGAPMARMGTGTGHGSVIVWRGGGQLMMGAAPSFVLTSAPTAADPGSRGFGAVVSSAGDVNGDGLVDLVVADRSGDAAVWIAGGGTFTRDPSWVVAPTFPPPTTGFGLGALPVTGVGDMNGDGYSDVAYTSFDSAGANAQLHITSGGTAGTPLAMTTVMGFSDHRQHYAFLTAAGDINGDGRADLVAGNPAIPSSTGVLGAIDVLLTSPTSTSLQSLPIVGGTPTFGASVAGGMDLNGDGRADIVVYTAEDHTLHVYGFEPTSNRVVLRQDLVVAAGFERVSSAGDMDGDGYGDVVVWGGGSEALYRGSPTGLTFDGATLPPANTAISSTCIGPFAARAPGVMGDNPNETDDLVTAWVNAAGGSRLSFMSRGTASDLDGGLMQVLSERPVAVGAPGVDFGATVAGAW